MCGITGFILSSPHPDAGEAIDSMVDRLDHRGPDARGTFQDKEGQLFLGHNRLSILDLSAEANQPFFSSDGRYVIVYNGELYNYRELAASLADFQPRTHCDTEIVLESYIQGGRNCLGRFNGMFAFAIWDQRLRELFLARDRIGIKPLYIYQDSKVLAFGSELKAIEACNYAKDNLQINGQAFLTYLHMGSIPQPMSVYEQVSKVPAGSYMLIDSALSVDTGSYWNSPDFITPDTLDDPAQAKKELANLLKSSVQDRLVSDVPIGTFLSGGIDSSLVSALAAQQVEEPLKTFTIGFKESKFDESKYASAVAHHLKTDHQSWMLSDQDAIPLLEEVMETYDEPFADTSAIPTMLVSRLAREHVKVILTGDGGDELFHGYGAYTWAGRLDMVKNKYLKDLTALLLNATGKSRLQRASNLFRHPGTVGLRNHIFSQEQYYFANQEINRIVSPRWNSSPFEYTDPVVSRGLTPAELQSLFDLNHYLPDDLLTKVDRASMKYSLECRVPLLDHRIVEFALNLHPRLKKRGERTKILLKDVLFDMVPESLFERPKWGFSIPLEAWLQRDLKYLMDRYLNRDLVGDLGYFRVDEVMNLVQRFKSGQKFLYNRLWLIILWHKWISR